MIKLNSKNEGIKVLSLFDGMSCGQIALNKLGVKIHSYYASEIKPHAIKVTQHNYPNTIQLGDVTKVKYIDGILYSENGQFNVGKIDLVIGGSPCQNFSMACIKEKRLGLDGEKSKLFYQYLRILEEVNPTYFLLENVASMSKESKKQLDNYMQVDGVLLDSSLVSGQIRKRYYWSNIQLKNTLQDKNIQFKDVLEYGYTNRNKSRTLTESMSRPNKIPVKMYHRYVSTGFTTVIFKDQQHYIDCKNHYDSNFKGLSAIEIDNKIHNGINVTVYNGLRYADQNELEKLQNVPEGYTSPVTRNHAASLLGDGWTVDVIAHIFSFMEFEENESLSIHKELHIESTYNQDNSLHIN